MFEKLLSALPFNPGTVQQLSFYASRVRREQSVRRIGLVFIALAFIIQFFAFVSPPTPTLADSPNDLVNGGFNSPATGAVACNNNVTAGPGTIGYQQILANYGITCADVANSTPITITSTETFGGQPLWSMGRDSEPTVTGNQPVTIDGYTLWVRLLSGWDSPGTTSTYQALNVTNTGGQTLFLLYNCGNLVSAGQPQPVSQPPSFTFSKTTAPGYVQANNGTVPPGQTLGFRLIFSNTGGAATNVQITDPQPANTTETWIGSPGNGSFANGVATWNFSSMPSGSSDWYVDVNYQVNANTPNGTSICNTASLKSDQTASQNSNQICFTVQSGSQPPPTTPTPPPQQPACEQQLSSENTSACLTFQKSAANLTENISNANGTTAQAGDTIQYTLSATNNGSTTVSYPIQDSLTYVLDYSSLVDAGGGSLNTSTNELSWPAVDIDAGKTVTKTFEVKVDNPIPDTPPSTSDPNYFNMTMTNYFGNTITIKLPSTPVQSVQTTAASLPNTGPGSSIIIGAIVVAVAGFFFYRSRLISREAKIAISEQSGGI